MLATRLPPPSMPRRPARYFVVEIFGVLDAVRSHIDGVAVGDAAIMRTDHKRMPADDGDDWAPCVVVLVHWLADLGNVTLAIVLVGESEDPFLWRWHGPLLEPGYRVQNRLRFVSATRARNEKFHDWCISSCVACERITRCDDDNQCHPPDRDTRA